MDERYVIADGLEHGAGADQAAAARKAPGTPTR